MLDKLYNNPSPFYSPARILVSLIRVYQILLSPVFGTQCRFYPSCSHYAQEAVLTHGCLKGSMLTVSRICRCNPLCEGGLDPVPPLLNPVSKK